MNSLNFLCICISLLQFVSCQDFQLRQHLATKSPYWIPPASAPPAPLPDPSCVPVHINLLARHGSRNPTTGDIKGLDRLQASISQYRSSISSDYEWLKNWTSPYDLLQQGYLSYNGELEHYHLGQRFSSNFTSLLNMTFSPDTCVLQSTMVSRTGMSGVSFAFGMYEGKGTLGTNDMDPFYIYTEDISSDMQLRFFDACPAYVDLLDSDVINSSEATKYVTIYSSAIGQAVADKLGVSGIWSISEADLHAMFIACAFDASSSSPDTADNFCSLFSDDDILQYETGEDLDAYYMNGYGNSMNYLIAAPLLQSMVDAMDAAFQGGKQKAYLRFAHAETIMPLISLLGLYKDPVPLTASMSPDELAARQWHTSMISPFASNVALVAYECANGGQRVRALHNEREVILPGCDEVYCCYDVFREVYASYLSQNTTSMCFPESAPPPPPSPEPPKDSNIRINPFVLASIVVGASVLGAALSPYIVLFFKYLKGRGHSTTSYSKLPTSD